MRRSSQRKPKFGHLQTKCFVRLEKNAPCVDEKGSPYTSNKGRKVHTDKKQDEIENNINLAGVRVGAICKDSNQDKDFLNFQ